jgi:hypothetical protein
LRPVVEYLKDVAIHIGLIVNISRFLAEGHTLSKKGPAVLTELIGVKDSIVAAYRLTVSDV